MPNSPDFISGLINLRGKIIPVIDLRKSLNLEAEKSSHILITEIKEQNFGLVIAIARSVNGSIFARSFERFWLMYETTLIEAIRAAESVRIVAAVSISDKSKRKIENTENQISVISGSRMMYSTM